MTDLSLEEFTAVIDLIYKAAYEPSGWDAAVLSLRALFNGSKACFVRHASDTQPSEVVAPDADPAYNSVYLERFINNDLARAIALIPAGLCYNDHAVIGHDRMRRSVLWNEWMAPQDMYGSVSCKLLQDDDSFWFIDVQRGAKQGGFQGDDLELLQKIAPHLRQAAHIDLELRAARAHASLLEHVPFGVVLVDGAGRVLAHNAAAEAAMARPGCPVSLAGRQLCGTDAATDGKLLALIASAAGTADGAAPGLGGTLYLPASATQKGLLGYSVSVRPLRDASIYGVAAAPCVAVFVRDITLSLPEGFESDVQSMFALSPKEARIACAIASGLSLKKIAELEQIKLSTARFYLHHIFRKTDTTQQSHLAALLKSLLG